MTDTITLASPLFGRLAERALLVPYLRRLIRQRNHALLAALGAAPTTEPGAPTWPAGDAGIFRRSEATALIGTGDELWERVTRDILHWKVKTRSGFRVDDASKVSSGRDLSIAARIAGVTIREPVGVATVVETPTRVGFAYRTRRGHPVSGEEAFIVHRDGANIWFTVRSLTAPATEQPWRALFPLLRVAQIVARRRYLRALR